MFWLPVTSFVCAVLIAVASSIWIRPTTPLGKSFWILTLVVMLPSLIFPLMVALTPPDPYGYKFIGLIPTLLFFGPVAAGWLFGVLVVVLIRFVRIRRGLAL